MGYYLHWSASEILQMSHRDRIRWCNEVSKINRELNEEKPNVFDV